MEIKQTLKSLVSIHSITCKEEDIAEKFTQMMKEIGYETWKDQIGNGYAKLKTPKTGAKTIMLTAHGDESGLVVTGFTDEGFVRIADWSGIDFKILPGSEVVLHGKKCNYPGVIGILPPHLQKPGDKKAIPESKLYADMGVDLKEAKNRVDIGDHVTFRRRFTELLGDRIATNALDDKLGVTVLVELGKKLMRRKLDVNVILVCTTREEIGADGAKRAALEVGPDFAIAVDTCPGEQYGLSGSPDFEPFAKDPVLEIGPMVAEKTNKALEEAAKRVNLSFKRTTWWGGTEADQMWMAGLGTNVAVITIPIRYLHQPVEMVDIATAENTVTILDEFVAGLDSDMKEIL